MSRKATAKNYQAVREKSLPFREGVVKNITHGDLKDHGGNSTVHMVWNLNEESIRDHIFMISINGQEAYLDLEEFLGYSRLI